MKKIPLFIAGLMVLPAISHGQTIQQFLEKSTVTGNIRSYYYNQMFAGDAVENRYAFSLGGMIKVQTAPLYGVSAGVAFYTANDLGANETSGDQKRLDPLLMGTRTSLNVLGQAYLQYQNPWLKVDVGNLLLNTPWMGPADAFMIPNTYQAVTATLHPLPDLSIIAIREFRYKNRIQADYHRQTLLNYNAHYSYLPDNSDGTLAFGIKGQKLGIKAAAWFYRFYDLTNMFYGTVDYTTPVLFQHFQPFADFQYAREWADGGQLAGPVNATVFGGMLGLKAQFGGMRGSIFAAYNHIPQRATTLPNSQTLMNGGFISPFSQQYSADPLYTSIMNYGLVSASASGHAWKAGFVFFPLPNLRFKYSYSWYHTAPFYPNVDANYIDVTYTPGGFWKGLSLRNLLAIDHSNPFANYHGTFVDDRLMLQYSF
ncbi:hypothetical protein HFU84_13220 [Acidithiobacillus sp. CV18-2]|uniref:Outer membrane porin, OprD family n=1 Tax=Igneacidithiobacillus copahuensis TaxID=2724909 RepID=A0AAE2YQC7_9PROT|nr:hypothetical protein [Igneacidithiobacillus copahuensis]MBU2755125.1 hypothetical protein [Acidithiobacillus sp. CV18-3]MBU2756069.1 hypothetical protein [Acidithiobacillus sp. BN09-2]MBU2778435.1 hypothetical protein [Acidithiobacillus sp. CV18-2]MBU2796135.1 hypothetical protein [Acidithiobacillus sp. VAN18-2]MBU2800369.1 hypothetical protein [Acidithiobacillus sp. VAN18-4]UTV80162.1 hypothetical protein MQE22_09010 [Acidithiobacillus sp. YTS05]